MGITPDGGFLYVANSGSSNVSAFAMCNQVVTSCSDPTSPDGTLTASRRFSIFGRTGAHFHHRCALGKIPVCGRPAVQPNLRIQGCHWNWRVDSKHPGFDFNRRHSDGVTLREGTTIISTTQGTTDYLYVTNLGASTMTAYSFDSTAGVLGLVGSAVITGGQPSAVAAK